MSQDTALPNERWLTTEVAQRAWEDMQKGMAQARAAGKPIVTFMGSARISDQDRFYQHARMLAESLGQEGFAILTGGGTGVMAAANEGAIAVGAPSLGIRMDLLKDEHVDEALYTDLIVTRELLCIRRFLLTTVPHALVVYPGGYGTLNEVSEILMLVQNSITARIPIVCLEDGRGFWTKFRTFLQEQALLGGYIGEGDLDLFQIVNIEEPDSVNRVSEYIRDRVAALKS